MIKHIRVVFTIRRANGTGSISKLPKGRRARYSVRVSYPHPELPGRYCQKYLGYYQTLAEAQAALKAFEETGQRPQAIGVTLGEVYEKWSERKFAKAGKSTIKNNQTAWKHFGVLANTPIDKLRTDDLQDIIDEMEENDYSKPSMSGVKTQMSQVFKYALEHDLVRKDYSQFVKVPETGAKQERRAFTEQELNQIWDLVDAGFPWADSVIILCYTGFRIEALLELTQESYHADGDYLVGGVKTAAGKGRVVPVHPRISGLLQKRLAEGHEYIFSVDGGKVPYSTYRKDMFKPVVGAIGLPQAGAHWCRHTMASRMRMAGVNDLAVKRILGHANEDVTDRYSHANVEFLTTELRKMT